jgi:AAA+ ATPase superfamily predicted ATPase
MEFINRKVELALLTEKLEQFKEGKRLNTSHLAFLGLRRTGKTYLVKEFVSLIMQKHKDIIPLFIDISKLTEEIKSFCDTILSEFAKSYEKSYIEPDLDVFFHSFAKGSLYEAYKHYQKQTEPAKIFDTLLKLLTLISEQQKLVIIFDEFQDILEFTKIK